MPLNNLKRYITQSLINYFNVSKGIKKRNVYRIVLTELEIELFKEIMEYTNNNQTRTAKILGISRGVCNSKLKTYRII